MKKGTGLKEMIQNPFLKKGVQSFVSFFVLAIVWCVLAWSVGNAYLLPSLKDTLKACGELLKEQEFYTAVSATLTRALLAFVISFASAVLLGVCSAVCKWIGEFFAPIISFLRSLPTMAVLLMILLWTNASVAPVVIAWLVLFPMLYSSVLSAISSVDNKLIEMSSVYGVGARRRITQLYLPTVFPIIGRDSGAALSFAMKLVVSAEVMSNTFQSMGGNMQQASLYDQTPTLFALTLFVFLIGYLLECLTILGVRLAERRFL